MLGAESFLKSYYLMRYSRISPDFMEAENSLAYV